MCSGTSQRISASPPDSADDNLASKVFLFLSFPNSEKITVDHPHDSLGHETLSCAQLLPNLDN